MHRPDGGDRVRQADQPVADDHGCSGCAMFTDNLGHLAHLNARDVTFVLVSHAPQADVNVFIRDGDGSTAPTSPTGARRS